MHFWQTHIRADWVWRGRPVSVRSSPLRQFRDQAPRSSWKKDNIWMFTIFLNMLIWNEVTSLVDMLYQNYHTSTQRFCSGQIYNLSFQKKTLTLSLRDSWRCWSWFQRFPPPPRCWASAWTKSPAGREQSGNRQYSSSLELQDAKRIQNHLRRKELTMPPRQEKVPIIKRGMILLIAPWIHLMDVAQ